MTTKPCNLFLLFQGAGAWKRTHRNALGLGSVFWFGLCLEIFFICLFCEGEEISKIIQEKHDGFHLKKRQKESHCRWYQCYLRQKRFKFIYLLQVLPGVNEADATLAMCTPCTDFWARIPTSWLLTGWVLKRMKQAQHFRHTGHSIWAKDKIPVLKVTTACESTAEETGHGVIAQWAIYIKELLNNSL